MARKKIIAGNWKMNMTPSEAVKLVETLKPLVVNDEVDVVFCVPAIDIIPVVEAAKGTNIQVGAENMYFEEKGAYTGEIAPAMLVDAGVKYVVLGHSERREYFGETNEDVNKKMLKAFEHGITPIMSSCFFSSFSSSRTLISVARISELLSTPVRFLLSILRAADSLKPRTFTRLCITRICSMSFSVYWRTFCPTVLGFRCGNSVSQKRSVLSRMSNIAATSLIE